MKHKLLAVLIFLYILIFRIVRYVFWVLFVFFFTIEGYWTQKNLLLVGFFICFLYSLSTHLRGRKKILLEFVLMLLVISAATTSFILLGWKWGACFTLFLWLLIGFLNPITQKLAYKILGRTPEP